MSTSNKPSSPTAANKFSLFDRLTGLETEYAIRFTGDSGGVRHPRFSLYRRVIASLHDRIPLARARHFKEGVFVANGGAVWFEAERLSGEGGLIEGSTPECRGPRQLVAYQRAQDAMLRDAASRSPGEPIVLIKNDRDAKDNVLQCTKHTSAQETLLPHHVSQRNSI